MFSVLILLLYFFVTIFALLCESIILGVLALGGSFFLGGILLISLGIDFLGLMYLIVGSGATTILFLFVLMLLNLTNYKKEMPLFYITGTRRYRFFLYLLYGYTSSFILNKLYPLFCFFDFYYLFAWSDDIFFILYLDKPFLYKTNFVQTAYALYIEIPVAVYLVGLLLFLGVLGSIHFVLKDRGEK